MKKTNRKRTKPQSKQSNQRNMYIYALVAVLVVIAAGLVWNTVQSRSNDVLATQQRINPAQYQITFVQPHKAHLLVDVRTPEEFAGGHIPGAINISLQTLPQRMQELPQDQPIVVYCRSGSRSSSAARLLARAGFTDIYDLGGIIAWNAQGLPIQ